ncbi:MAG TPA: hypothetical protein VMC81_14105 [Rhodocyclaceae bacterium]|nr:hypothetical protein [Rhodocyclaceae bacterium]
MTLLQALLVAWFAGLMLPRRHRWLAFVLAACSLIPWHQDVSAAMASRALWGDPSVTTIQLTVLSLLGRAPLAFRRAWRGPAVISIAGLVFYVLALGMGNFDPYQTGYHPVLLVALLAAPAVVLWWRNQPVWLWLLAVDLLAFSAHVLESTNFWDYAIDPLLALVCLILAMRNFFSSPRGAIV